VSVLLEGNPQREESKIHVERRMKPRQVEGGRWKQLGVLMRFKNLSSETSTIKIKKRFLLHKEE
jgi:hypothetical protein